MIGRNTFKRAVKQTAGWAAVMERMLLEPKGRPRACIFYYHRIAEVDFVDPQVDDWNVSPKLFERQVATLAEYAEIIPLRELPHRLKAGTELSKPLVCLTFDDGYASFYTQALPILERYRAPATAFVITGMIGRTGPMPFDGWSLKNRTRLRSDAWRAMNWNELEACLASGLVTIGAHSHNHRKGSLSTEAEMKEEAERSRYLLRNHLGPSHGNAYAYPFGSTRLRDVTPEYVSAVRSAGYELAVTTDLGLADADSDSFTLPRIEAHALDLPGVLRAKAMGALLPYRLTEHLRVVNRAL
jgi:peptidoglycan/xylan/chitin deacetylase (PgdA/CDA1 family)